MRLALVFISTVLFQFMGKAQLDEFYKRKLTMPAPPCVEKLYNAQKVIPAYYAKGQRDSIEFILSQLKTECEENITTYHVEVILQISKDSFAIDAPEQLLKALISYKKEERELINENKELITEPDYYDYYSDWGEVILNYYRFIENFAGDVLTQQTLEPFERDLLRFYTGEYDQLLDKLKRNNYSQNDLQKVFKEQISSLIYDEGVMMTLYAGYWMPTDNLSHIGDHPEVGFQVGYFKGKMKYGLMLGVRFLDAPEPYRVRENDSNYVTDDFTGLQVGGEIGRALYKGARNELDLNLGLAYDGITLVQGDEEDGIDPVGMESVNLNVGLEYRFYYNLKNFVALDARYHFLNYKNNINSEMYGNALTLRLTWGFTSSYERKNTLHALGY